MANNVPSGPIRAARSMASEHPPSTHQMAASALGRVHIAPSPSPSAENRAGRGTNLRHVSGANVEVRPSIAAAQPGRQSSWLPQFGLYSSREHVTELRQPDRRVDD